MAMLIIIDSGSSEPLPPNLLYRSRDCGSLRVSYAVCIRMKMAGASGASVLSGWYLRLTAL
eukprot:scaffold1908_cov104-Isochrysis_galbana.AAC.3